MPQYVDVPSVIYGTSYQHVLQAIISNLGGPFCFNLDCLGFSTGAKIIHKIWIGSKKWVYLVATMLSMLVVVKQSISVAVMKASLNSLPQTIKGILAWFSNAQPQFASVAKPNSAK